MSDSTIKKLITFLCVFVLCLIALGGAVRAMDAGLSCPDWPLCFGKFIPDFHPQVYFEFIHRVIAGLVAVFTAVLTYAVYKKKQYPKIARVLVTSMCAVLILQIIMGGLTVLKLLYFGVVTLHLLLGMLFFTLLCTLHFLITRGFPKPDKKVPGFLVFLTSLTVAAVFGQILLGGLVSSNYAGLACPDFPLCNGRWIPTLDGIVGLQVIHRLGAYTTFAILYFVFLVIRLNLRRPWMKRSVVWSGQLAISFIMLQLVIGMSNVLFKVPPVITVAHLAVAAITLFFCLRMALSSYYEAP
jgi:cytochrome c oxidase assembly protein subunit 15